MPTTVVCVTYCTCYSLPGIGLLLLNLSVIAGLNGLGIEEAGDL